MVNKLPRSIVILLLSPCLLMLSMAPPPKDGQGPVALKIQELRGLYLQKKAAGCEVSEVEKTIEQIKQARGNGNPRRFRRLLRKAEKQLAKIELPAAPVKVAPPVPPPAERLSTDVALENSPWPMYCHDRRHTCRSPYRGLTTAPERPKWIFTSPGGHGISSPVAIAKDGTLYVGTWKNKDFTRDKREGHSGLLCALSPEGRLLWAHDSARGSLLASAIESAPLLTADGKIIYGKDDGYVYALDRNGKVLWQFACDDVYNPARPFDDNEQVIPSPVLGPNGIIYICSHWGNVYNPMVIGELQKRIPAMKKLDIKPAKQPTWGKIYAIDPKNADRLWVYDPSAGVGLNKKTIFGSPAVADDGTIYVGTYDNTQHGDLFALNPNGTLKWRFPQGDNRDTPGFCGSPAIADDGTIYIGSFGSTDQADFYAFNPDGSLKWRYAVKENRITGAPAIGPDGTIYVGAHNWGFTFNPGMSKQGHLYALKDAGKKAEKKWSFTVDYGILAPPAIDNRGNVFFGTNSDPKIIDSQGAYRIYALNKNGQELWSYDLSGRVYSPPAIDKNGTVYVGTTLGEARLYAFGPNP